ncbi:MAG: RagB/SusD family nutrient uptake outer membrane protein, partial [Gemmatimonadota bacterium]
MRINERPRGSRGRLALLALPAVLALGLFGCDDFLTTEPKAQLTTENFFTSAAQAEQATNATYAMLRNWSVHVFAYLGMTDIASDDATKGSVPADASFLLELDNINFDPGNNAFSGTWTGYYQGIYRANVAIQNIPDIEMDEQVRARLVGENQFLRAYYYAFLARAFGGVPLITEPLNPGEYFQPRATREAVFDQIEQDLNDAIAVLPPQSQYGPADIGRASRGAAQALLARVHLFQGEYQQAYDAATAVINSGEYSLYPDYAEIFTYDGENSSESVFEVQVIAVDGGNNGPSGGATQHAQVQGVRGPPNNLGWGFNTPSPDLEASYEPGDPRLQATILYPWENLKFSTDRLTWINPSMPNNRFNQKVQQPADNPGGSGNSGVNIRVIRYSDVLLMAAEAAYQLGNTGEATTWLNMVRERARGDNTVTAGFTAEMLDASVTTGVLGLPTSSRVIVRYVNPES